MYRYLTAMVTGNQYGISRTGQRKRTARDLPGTIDVARRAGTA